MRLFQTGSGCRGLRFVCSEPAIGTDIAPAHGPPLWDGCDAQAGVGIQIEPDWDLAAQTAPDYEVDQRVNW